MYRVINEHLSDRHAILPPNGTKVYFDLDGVSDEVDKETAKETCTVPGYELFSSPETVPGETGAVISGPTAHGEPAEKAEVSEPAEQADAPEMPQGPEVSADGEQPAGQPEPVVPDAEKSKGRKR